MFFYMAKSLINKLRKVFIMNCFEKITIKPKNISSWDNTFSEYFELNVTNNDTQDWTTTGENSINILPTTIFKNKYARRLVEIYLGVIVKGIVVRQNHKNIVAIRRPFKIV